MFRNGGLAAAAATLLVVAWVSCDNMIVLVHLAEMTGRNSYGQVGVLACGMWYVMYKMRMGVLQGIFFCKWGDFCCCKIYGVFCFCTIYGDFFVLFFFFCSLLGVFVAFAFFLFLFLFANVQHATGTDML